VRADRQCSTRKRPVMDNRYRRGLLSASMGHLQRPMSASESIEELNVTPIRLLLVEDDRALAEGIAMALRRSGYTVAVAPWAADAMRLAQAETYDIGILDLGLPDRDGLDLLHDMRTNGIVFPVLILTARALLDDRIRGLDSGADDYLVKPFALGELEARLRALTRRREEKVPWRQLGRLRFDLAGKRALTDDGELELTRRELAILDVLIRRADRVVPKLTLYEVLFRDDADTTTNAVEVQVSRLRRKIEPAGLGIRALRGLGYRLEQTHVDDDAERAAAASPIRPRGDSVAPANSCTGS
jgi:two-component system, OmpR family, response regulator